ncbi:Cytochrome P450 4B1-like [Oopsacas minuta]|uniref:Cytochrome P450 4B1-like n=1 Tax=Oopsacas minuta TaxID=111878 RepID=A0AAV7KJZ5_9METZ|nr:Cytochrome P450 4B1-like [Oopsacas minuta]
MISVSISVLIYTALALFGIFYLSKFVAFLYSSIKLRYFFPGPKTVSIFGHGLTDFGEEDLEKLESYVKQYPRMHRVVYGHMVRIVVACPELIALAYAEIPDKDRIFLDMFTPAFGNGLAFSSGEIWKRNRRLLTPLFHFKCLESFCEVFNKTGDHFVEVISTKINGNSFDFSKLARLATFEATMNSICSKDCDLQNNLENNPDQRSYLEMLDLLTAQSLIRFNNFLYIMSDTIYYMSKAGKDFLKNCKDMRNLMAKFIHERRALTTEEPREYNDLLDLIMKSRDEDGSGLSDEEMIDELSNFFVAGFETTTCGISFLMYCLCRHPEWQEKCREEIMEVLGDSETIAFEDINKFECLNMCLKESLRLYSPATLVQRIVDKPVQMDGYTLKKGTPIDIGIQSVHMNPTVWQEPSKFDPNRFSKENMEGKHPYSFIPFSAGARNCIGQHFALAEMKVLSIKLLRSYEFSLEPGYEMIRETTTVLTQKGGLSLIAKPIQS